MTPSTHHQPRSANRLAIISIAVATLAPIARAANYSAGGFAVGTGRFTSDAALAGQDAPNGLWRITSNANPAAATVRSTVGVNGGAGLEVSNAGGKTNTQWYIPAPLTPSTTLSTVNVNWAMNYVHTSVPGLTYGPLFGIEVFDASGAGTPKQIGGFGVDSTTGDLLVLVQDGGVPVYATLLAPTVAPAGSYANYGISVDYAHKTYSVSYAGLVLETDPFIDASAATFTDAAITTRLISYYGQSSLNAGTAYFDDYAISLVPEPTAALGIAAFCVGLTARRR